ncbi:small integral membrane protein 12-A-like [Artemia franciscana]|uniref:small integral membrane protein 12-A-like n=1 Tax=Artemia franciscana TaxID=6661 RepID=UPI0032DA01D5
MLIIDKGNLIIRNLKIYDILLYNKGMIPAVWAVLRSYAPALMLPVAALVGLIGYSIESRVSDRYTPYKDSIGEAREERQLEEVLSKEGSLVESIKEKKFVPKSVFEKNVSPSLQK